MGVAIKNKIKVLLKLLGLYSKSVWPKISENKKKRYVETIKLKTSIETLEDIKKTIIEKKTGAYLRFGDGDIYLLLGLDDLYHKANKNLSKEMKQVFKLNKGIFHKAFPLNSNLFGFEVGMKEDMHLVSDANAIKYVSVIKKYIKENQIYSAIALHYLSTYNQDYCVSFLNFLKSKKPVFVGNENIKKEIVDKLFGDIHIKTPSNNSYSEIDRIESELLCVLKKDEFRVVVIAMGCAGRILQKRILHKGYNVYLFDFGSLLDAFNGDNSRLWIDLAGVNNLNKVLDKIA